MKLITREYSDSKGTATLTGYILDSITVAPNKKRPAVIICPGGGYGHLSDREAEPVAMQFTSMCCHAFILRYSLAPAVFPEALVQLAKSVAWIRENAEEWHVDPERILICGFSAGGHLAACLGTFWNKEKFWIPYGLQTEQIKPNGMILCYPVVSSGEFCHPGTFQCLLGEDAQKQDARDLVSIEKQVDSSFPPTFLWHTTTDKSVPVENSFLLAEELLRNNVSLEMHIYPVGCHGLSLANEEVSGSRTEYLEPHCQSWILLVKTWIQQMLPLSSLK